MKIDRLIAIVMLLLEQEKMSAQTLADHFEVTPRTIYRDLESINQAGIPIVSTSGPGGGVEILKSYKIEKRLFSASDFTALLMGLRSIRSNLPGKHVLETLAKVEGMIPSEHQKELQFRAKQIKIDTTPWLYANDLTERIELIKEAMEQSRLLRFKYKDIRNGESVRTIEPYRLLLKGEDWYVQGYCLTRNDYRTFKLLRMQQVCILPNEFQLRDFPFEQLDSASFSKVELVSVTLRIHESIKDTITNRFGENCFVPDGNEYYIAHVRMPIDELACSYLLSLCDKCVCLEPESLKNRMRQLSEQIYRQYHSVK